MGDGSELPASGGSYVLVMRSTQSQSLPIGRLGVLALRPGWYLYVGSAFGPGGLRARVGRHLKRGKGLRWHLDYLREAVAVEEVWHSPGRRECAWAAALAALPGAQLPLARFGASDCGCPAHLRYFRARPEFAGFCALAGEVVLLRAGREGS